jgi:hypothetical protein
MKRFSSVPDTGREVRSDQVQSGRVQVQVPVQVPVPVQDQDRVQGQWRLEVGGWRLGTSTTAV